jgi:hypothetical protein
MQAELRQVKDTMNFRIDMLTKQIESAPVVSYIAQATPLHDKVEPACVE